MQLLTIGAHAVPARPGKATGTQQTEQDRYNVARIAGLAPAVAAAVAAGLIYVRKTA